MLCSGPAASGRGKALSGASAASVVANPLANIRLLRRESLTSSPNPSLRKEGLSARAPAASGGAEDEVCRIRLREIREIREIREFREIREIREIREHSLNSLNSLNSLKLPQPLPQPPSLRPRR